MSEVKTQHEDNNTNNNNTDNTLTNINSSEVIKRKKGRPRKDTSQMVDLPKQPEEKKKRGRKKKEVVVEEVKQKKKRGRKAAVKYFSSSIRKKIPLTTVLQDNNNYILHLDVKHDENSIENNSEDDVDVNIDVNTEDVNTEDVNTESRKEKFDAINMVFEKLKNENIENLYEIQKEYQNLVEKEDNLLSDILNNENDLTDLYEKCIENRENQDILLFNKLEMVHKDNNVINIFDEFENNNNSNRGTRMHPK